MKVGDKVIIVPRRGMSEDYSFFYVDGMTELYAGKTATIVNVKKDIGFHKGTIPDDGKIYTLDIDGGKYRWASSMLLPASTSSTTDQIKEVLKVRVTDDDNRYQINFNL